MSDITDVPLWSDDHTYHVSFRVNRALSNPIPVTDQRAWDTCIEKRIHFQIKRLCCEDVYFPEGVKVKRTSAPGKQSYNVNNDRGEGKDYFKRYTLDEAVGRVMELVAEREKWKVYKNETN